MKQQVISKNPRPRTGRASARALPQQLEQLESDRPLEWDPPDGSPRNEPEPRADSEPAVPGAEPMRAQSPIKTLLILAIPFVLIILYGIFAD